MAENYKTVIYLIFHEYIITSYMKFNVKWDHWTLPGALELHGKAHSTFMRGR